MEPDIPPPSILLVAYGVLRPESRRVYTHIEATLARHLPGHAIEWAFSSRIIAERMRERGEPVRHFSEVVEDLRARPRPTVIQSLHVVPGQEYNQLREQVAGLDQVALGSPLLFDEGDLNDVIRLLELEIRPHVPNVVVCHGNDKFPEYNQRYEELAQRLELRHAHTVVASLEGSPGPGRLIEIRPKAEAAGAVHFIPLLIVAGSHVLDDVMGEGEHAWQRQLGVPATCSPPLGYNDCVIEIFRRHIEAAMQHLKQN